MSFGIPQPPNRPPPPPVHRSLPRPPQVGDYNNDDDNGGDGDYNYGDDNGDDNDIVDDDHCTKSTSVADGQWQDLRPAPATQSQED